MQIRKTTVEDITKVMQIYAEGREIMCESGNHEQWQCHYPPQAMIEEDIKKGLSYVCECGNTGVLLAVFFFSTEPDPTYTKINGAWLNNEKYGVIHRIARKKNAKGMGAFCLKWCFGQIQNIRIDTHEANIPMRKLLKNLGFSHCGTIWLENGDERMAFHRVEDVHTQLV